LTKRADDRGRVEIVWSIAREQVRRVLGRFSRSLRIDRGARLSGLL